VVDGADLEVKGIDLEAEGLVRGSSSEREASQKEKWRHTMARRSSEAMGGGGYGIIGSGELQSWVASSEGSITLTRIDGVRRRAPARSRAMRFHIFLWSEANRILGKSSDFRTVSLRLLSNQMLIF
jgi:hypothetical protein